MNKFTNIIKKVLSETEISLYADTISRESLLKDFGAFVSDNTTNENHTVVLAMHTGSVCFDVIAITYAAILCLLNNESESDDVLQSLEIGDMVLFGSKKKERFIYEGIVNGKNIHADADKEYVVLSQNNGSKRYVSQKSWRLIEPYKGSSKRTDGRGIRKKTTLRDEFYTDVLGVSSNEIPSVIDASCVLCMNRDKADYLLKGISIRFNNKMIKLLELVTASYFTEDDEYRYGGNTSKNEASLKITSKISVARRMLYSRKGNFHVGLFVLDKEVISRGISELPELMNRKSLGFVFICSDLDFDLGMTLLNEYEETEIFACTKEYLLETYDGLIFEENKYTLELSRQIDIIRNQKNIIEIIGDEPITKSDYKLCRKYLLQIKRSEFSSHDKENFVIQSHSLMNYFLTAPFSVNTFEAAKQSSLIDVDSPAAKIVKLEEYVLAFPAYLKAAAEIVVNILRKALKNSEMGNGKTKWVNLFLTKNSNQKICIVVPKAYYVPIIQDRFLHTFNTKKNLTVTTMGRFDSTKLYDFIIVVGDIEGRNFNPFQCNNSKEIISLIYAAEKGRIEYKKTAAKQREMTITRKAKHEEVPSIPSSDNSLIDIKEDVEINEYISSLDTIIFGNYNGNSHGATAHYSQNTEIVAVAVFSDDMKAFLSKNYKGYVIDEVKGIVKECGSLDLREGDSLIFTKNNNDTKDIVDTILVQLINENKITGSLKNAYYESKRWKNALTEYKNNHNLSERKMSSEMVKKGFPVQETTLLIWLDEDAHIVGPRKEESIVSIAEFVGDKKLKEDSSKIFQSCKEIRGIRRKILDQIGMAIIDRFAGKETQGKGDFSIINDRIDSLAEVKQIERITLSKQVIPNNLVNRALNL